jgi:hypothetical protein
MRHSGRDQIGAKTLQLFGRGPRLLSASTKQATAAADSLLRRFPYNIFYNFVLLVCHLFI